MSRPAKPTMVVVCAITASIIAVGTSACTSLAPSPPEPTESAATLPPGLAATGVFLSPDGSTTGRAEVTIAEDGAMTVSIMDLESSHDVLTASASFRSRENDACQDGGGLSWGEFDSGQPAVFTQPVSNDFLDGDWTAFDEVDLTVFTSGPGSQCINTIVARAPLDWAISPLRPQLAALEDSGPRSGANGAVTLTDGGRPVAYVVAPNDRLADVAERFGIASDDLFYLNLSRDPNPRNPMLYVAEELNLDLKQR